MSAGATPSHAGEPVADAIEQPGEAGAARIEAQRAFLGSGWQSIDNVVVRATEYGVFAIGILFTVMITLEVISRYVFSFSIFFVNSAARLLLVWFFLMGAGLALRHGAHVGFELLLSALAAPKRRVVVLTGEFLGLLFFAEMVWGGLYALPAASRQIEPGLGVSLVWAFLAIPVGFALLAYHMVLLIVVELKQRPQPEPRP